MQRLNSSMPERNENENTSCIGGLKIFEGLSPQSFVVLELVQGILAKRNMQTAEEIRDQQTNCMMHSS